jgi:XisI protein
MEKIKKYQKILLKLLEDYAQVKSPFMPEVENLVISDLKNHHYQLVRMGWYKDNHVHYSVFHFSIIDQQIWIQENRTDAKIEEELIELGVPSKDIVAGMRHPSMKIFLQKASA